ncbi:hypothetical protein OH491_23590 [Termitidicoccus mucosus]|uniref:Imelysin-like domain-containing protein n=2 Tax=Termitidicoccus mucosus TaxID=1184151 RepID=A0A178INP2_9BACT|nr:hypothetical protein AW736_02885 [Opitutaceae bacterium TSB47]
MKTKLLILACVLAAPGVITRHATAADGIAPDAAYEQMVDGRIAVNYYNEYLQEIVVDARSYLVKGLADAMGHLDEFVAKGDYGHGGPVFSSNWRNAKDILSLPTRVPDWYAAADLKLFKNGIDQIRKDTDETLKLCEDLQKYLQYNGGWKNDKCQKYTDARPRLQTLLASLQKNTDALDRRALEMALAGEKLYWAQDKALGYFVATMKADTDTAAALETLVQNPELQKEGNTAAAATLPKAEKLLETLKASLAKNANLVTPMLGDSLKNNKERFYNQWLKDFIESAEKYIMPGLKKGVLKADESERLHGAGDNLGRHYDDCIATYTYNGGIAIKYKRL